MTVAKAASRSMATIAAREAAKAVFGRGKAASIGATVGGAVLRASQRTGIPTPITQRLVAELGGVSAG